MPDMPHHLRHRLPGLVGDLRQLASVQRITLVDGADAGQQLIAFSTGGGLDFQVKELGSLDIRSLHLRGSPVSWRHPAGDCGNPQRALSGFLVTCGLENVRAPRDGLPQHGSFPMSPVRVTHLGEDWAASTPELFVGGEITQSLPCGAVFRVTRRLSAPIGGKQLKLSDRIENISATSAEMMILYHMNFGFPVVAPGCEIRLGDTSLAAIQSLAAAHSPGEPECHKVTPDMPVIVERPQTGEWEGFRMRLSFDTSTLPFLQIWRDARSSRNILAIEPCNCDLRPDGTSAQGTYLQPQQIVETSVTLSFD